MPDTPSESPSGQPELSDMTESMHDVMSLGGDVDKLAAFYADWATDYDADVATHGYGLPEMMARTVIAAIDAVPDLEKQDRSDLRVMDAGCGTGLVGLALAAAGFIVIDGVDLSPEMVDVARTRDVYRTLEGGIDLTDPVPEHLAQAYDVATVGGVFTVGHVPPDALETMAGFVRSGGVLVVSTRRAYQEETGFEAVSDRLVASGHLDLLVHTRDAPYTMDSTGDYWAYRVGR